MSLAPASTASASGASASGASASVASATRGLARADQANDSVKRCCLTRQEFPRLEMVRFVVSPDGLLVPDLAERLPGRGAWVSATGLASVEASADSQALVSALKRALKPDKPQQEVRGVAPVQTTLIQTTLIQTTRALLKDRILSELGLARRSGLVVSGESQVRMIAQERGAQVRILLQASDGASDGVNKIARLVHNRAQACLRVQVFSAEQQGQALGRDGVVHVAVLSAPANRKYNPSGQEHGLTSRLKADLTRLLLMGGGQGYV